MLRRSVLENLAYPLMINGQDKQSAMERARTWATKIGLSAHMDRPAPFLSGGEKQKIALARALITSPKLLFLDEPTASLDGAATVEIEALLSEAQSTGTTIIMSTHNIGQARRMANRVLFMKDGQIDAHSAANAFFDTPPTEAAQKFIAGDIVV
jgi:tungstate transport system ATP-binding protein